MVAGQASRSGFSDDFGHLRARPVLRGPGRSQDVPDHPTLQLTVFEFLATIRNNHHIDSSPENGGPTNIPRLW
jgi:hypothetical protein